MPCQSNSKIVLFWSLISAQLPVVPYLLSHLSHCHTGLPVQLTPMAHHLTTIQHHTTITATLHYACASARTRVMPFCHLFHCADVIFTTPCLLLTRLPHCCLVVSTPVLSYLKSLSLSLPTYFLFPIIPLSIFFYP